MLFLIPEPPVVPNPSERPRPVKCRGLRRMPYNPVSVCRLSGSVLLGFDGGQGHGIDDVGHQSTTGEVVHRSVQTLQDRAYGQGARGALDGLVTDVSCTEVGEDEDVDLAGDGVALGLGGGYGGGPGRVELD